MHENTAILIPVFACQECCRPWADSHERWRMYVTDDEQPSLVPYCPDCADREFGNH